MGDRRALCSNCRRLPIRCVGRCDGRERPVQVIERMTADELSDMLVEAAAQGCCNNAEWRGHLCSFHQGYQDGVDAALESYAKLLWAAHSDGADDVRT